MPPSSLGALDVLPNELLHEVLLDLDALSYFRFRLVNRQARILASTLWEYRTVITHGFEGFRNVLNAKANLATVRKLHHALTQEKCTFCNDFGGFLFLYTAQRCCFTCLCHRSELRIIDIPSFSSCTGLSINLLYDRLGIPGSPDSYTESLLVLSSSQIIQALQFKVLDDETTGMLCDRFGRQLRAATPYPWYNALTGEAEHGVSCKECSLPFKSIHDLLPHGDEYRLFSLQGFLLHFESCTDHKTISTGEEGTRRKDIIFSEFKVVDHMAVTRSGDEQLRYTQLNVF
ncbi:hypothetical protein F53441_9127 [Fusarium austroafricanum]|uniref:F-box domain-containing protein n=1 Tax=Fusarium austroafricanum TaxID=2364996 RepID=A0A8H4NTN1_9HYPO|nr:hypothetical protein F53441_9127 [Fusarium austroafricanum]